MSSSRADWAVGEGGPGFAAAGMGLAAAGGGRAEADAEEAEEEEGEGEGEGGAAAPPPAAAPEEEEGAPDEDAPDAGEARGLRRDSSSSAAGVCGFCVAPLPDLSASLVSSSSRSRSGSAWATGRGAAATARPSPGVALSGTEAPPAPTAAAAAGAAGAGAGTAAGRGAAGGPPEDGGRQREGLQTAAKCWSSDGWRMFQECEARANCRRSAAEQRKLPLPSDSSAMKQRSPSRIYIVKTQENTNGLD